MERAFEDAFDQAILFHGYADYMRDYDVYVYATADPRSGIPNEHLRYRFTHCVRATIVTALPAETWAASLDDRLTDDNTAVTTGVDGYIWGARFQVNYPGMSLIEASPETHRWSAALGIPLHEAQILTNGHEISLVFSDLVVETLDPGRVAFRVPHGGPDFKIPLASWPPSAGPPS